ncbi:hypothetical protein [Candidatus Laterigemmans baculatus]|uniref:hypothetical protein n=1 Tax=Candidatus Laterigemmans baculatus TaxID=2770505 RepID=UPI0013DD3DA1|nr:hypothetical protein [Candidatus Laterigemmans baculatus]
MRNFRGAEGNDGRRWRHPHHRYIWSGGDENWGAVEKPQSLRLTFLCPAFYDSCHAMVLRPLAGHESPLRLVG